MKQFKVGDHVRWNSEAGIVSGMIIKKTTTDTEFKGYTHHASKDDRSTSSRAAKLNTWQFIKEKR